jgi:hypothetical protein
MRLAWPILTRSQRQEDLRAFSIKASLRGWSQFRLGSLVAHMEIRMDRSVDGP